MLHWLGRNLSTLLLAFLLAVVVWVSAVISADPNQELIYPRSVSLEIVGQDPGLLLQTSLPDQIRISIDAPKTIWDRLNANPGYVRAWIDLSNVGPGEHTLPIITQVTLSPVRISRVEPAEVRIKLESLLTRSLPVKLNVIGEPALGYRKGGVQIAPPQVTLSGPESLVSKIVEIRATMDITGATDTVRRTVSIQPVDEKGANISGVTMTPASVAVTQPISLLGGYRNVVVKVITNGQVAEGYWLTNVTVTPPNVTVFSSDPTLVNELPGFVEILPLNLANLSDDVDIRAALNLPEGVTLAGEESVLVRLSIAALEGSLPISLPLEVVGLAPEFSAVLSPDTVDVLLTGPLPILNNLNLAGIRVSINVMGLEPGTYQLRPVVDLLPEQVQVGSILPEEIQITIMLAPTPTPGAPQPTARIIPTATPGSLP